jgi:hypothetical protein
MNWYVFLGMTGFMATLIGFAVGFSMLLQWLWQEHDINPAWGMGIFVIALCAAAGIVANHVPPG